MSVPDKDSLGILDGELAADVVTGEVPVSWAGGEAFGEAAG